MIELIRKLAAKNTDDSAALKIFLHKCFEIYDDINSKIILFIISGFMLALFVFFVLMSFTLSGLILTSYFDAISDFASKSNLPEAFKLYLILGGPGIAFFS